MGTDWGENMLSSVATQSIRHLFSESESVDVAIQCYPASKLLQGSLDGIKMTGKRLVIRRDFPVEWMSFETDTVAVDFGSILGGKLRLKQSTQAVAKIILSEDGINRAFRAQLVRKRLENLTMPELTALSGGEPVSFEDVDVQLLPNNRLELFAKARAGGDDVVPICLRTTLTIERRRRVVFRDPEFAADSIPEKFHARSRDFSDALVEVLNDMVDLDRFNLDGVIMRLNRLETEGKNLVFSGYAQIEHFPNVG